MDDHTKMQKLQDSHPQERPAMPVLLENTEAASGIAYLTAAPLYRFSGIGGTMDELSKA